MWQIYHFRLGNIKKMDESFDAVLEFELEQMHRYEFRLYHDTTFLNM